MYGRQEDPLDYAPPEHHVRPAVRPAEARTPVATSPVTGDAPRTVPARFAGEWDEYSERDSL